MALIIILKFIDSPLKLKHDQVIEIGAGENCKREGKQKQD
jgi:hypothetical protein